MDHDKTEGDELPFQALYKGCALLQKTYTPDFLTKKAVKNDDSVPQYYVEDSHPAIIDPDQYQLV